jgi:hypothetical protein
MFTKSVAWYDAVYSWKNYEREAQRLRLLMAQHAQSTITTLLDVACGLYIGLRPAGAATENIGLRAPGRS